MLGEYNSVIQNQIGQGIVEPMEESSGDPFKRTHYLPHDAIIRHDQETTKMHIVYDASAHSGGPSLNDCLHAGPKFNQRILNMLRLRLHRVAVAAT